MGFKPQRACRAGRIESELLPPCCFIPVTMHFTMMSSAYRTILCKAQGDERHRLTSADQAGLLRDKPHMIAIANAAWLAIGQDGFMMALAFDYESGMPRRTNAGAALVAERTQIFQ